MRLAERLRPGSQTRSEDVLPWHCFSPATTAAEAALPDAPTTVSPLHRRSVWSHRAGGSFQEVTRGRLLDLVYELGVAYSRWWFLPTRDLEAVAEPMRQTTSGGATADPGPSVEPSPCVAALTWIEQAVTLPKDQIRRLFGVSRVSLHAWETGGGINRHHRERLLAVYEVLRRAQAQHPGPEALTAWLVTPVGPEAISPARLLEEGRIDQARLLAISTASPALLPPPPWVRRPSLAAGSQPEDQRDDPFSFDEGRLPPQSDSATG